jgi:hypothetical protein
MGYLQPESTSAAGYAPVFQNVSKVDQGGSALVSTGLSGTLEAGTPVGVNEATRKATVIKTAVLYADATNTATDYQVKKGHQFVVGNYFAATVGSKAYAITAIDTSNDDYDVITVGTTLGAALTAGQVFFQSSATGASAAALFVTPTGLIRFPVDVATDAPVVSVLDGVVYARRFANGYPDAVKSALSNIIFSQSY